MAAAGPSLWNEVSITFYLGLYGVEHMVKDHSNSLRGDPQPPHGLLFPISSKCSFICIIPQTGSHILLPCYTSRGGLAETRNSSMKDRSDNPPSHHDRTLLSRSYISLRQTCIRCGFTYLVHIYRHI